VGGRTIEGDDRFKRGPKKGRKDVNYIRRKIKDATGVKIEKSGSWTRKG